MLTKITDDLWIDMNEVIEIALSKIGEPCEIWVTYKNTSIEPSTFYGQEVYDALKKLLKEQDDTNNTLKDLSAMVYRA